MVWFKVDDSFYDHPKAEDLSDSAVALWTRAGSYCARHLTDGFVSHRKASRMCDNPETAISELVAAGLWEKDADGYRFHDWHEYQPTREEALAASKAKSIGGAVGNHRRWHVERGHVDPHCPYCRTDPHRLTDRITDRSTDRGTESVANRPSRPDPTQDKEHPSDVLFEATPASAATKRKRRAPTERGTRIPDDFGISKELRIWAASEIPGFDIDREFLRFRDYWRSQTGQKAVKKEWNSVFRNWMRRAFDERGPSQPAHNGVVPAQQPRQSGLPARYEPRGTAARADRQYPPSQSSEGRNYDGWQDIKTQMQAAMANGEKP